MTPIYTKNIIVRTNYTHCICDETQPYKKCVRYDAQKHINFISNDTRQCPECLHDDAQPNTKCICHDTQSYKKKFFVMAHSYTQNLSDNTYLYSEIC